MEFSEAQLVARLSDTGSSGHHSHFGQQQIQKLRSENKLSLYPAKWSLLLELVLISVTLGEKEHFYSSLDGMLVNRSPSPLLSIIFAVTHLYTWVERGTVKVKCLLAQEHNTNEPCLSLNTERFIRRLAWQQNYHLPFCTSR